MLAQQNKIALMASETAHKLKEKAFLKYPLWYKHPDVTIPSSLTHWGYGTIDGAPQIRTLIEASSKLKMIEDDLNTNIGKY